MLLGEKGGIEEAGAVVSSLWHALFVQSYLQQLSAFSIGLRFLKFSFLKASVLCTTLLNNVKLFSFPCTEGCHPPMHPGGELPRHTPTCPLPSSYFPQLLQFPELQVLGENTEEGLLAPVPCRD